MTVFADAQITSEQIERMLEEFGDYIKVVVDIERHDRWGV